MPVTSNLYAGALLATPKLPDASIVIPEVAVPPVIRAILFVPIKYRPESISLLTLSSREIK